MLRIHPQSYADFLEWCGALGVSDVPVPNSRTRVPEDAPWLDAPYQDLPMDYLHRLLSWEAIGGQNLVAGLPGITHSKRYRTEGHDDLLIFSVRGFLDHLRTFEPAAFERAASAGSLRAYNRDVGPTDRELTGEQDLTLVVAEVAEFCMANDLVLAIRY